jgi:hypothetical protein
MRLYSPYGLLGDRAKQAGHLTTTLLYFLMREKFKVSRINIFKMELRKANAA